MIVFQWVVAEKKSKRVVAAAIQLATTVGMTAKFKGGQHTGSQPENGWARIVEDMASAMALF